MPDEAPTPPAAGPYLSEEHKRRFTIVAGVLGAVFFFGQLLLPFVAMLLVGPFAMASHWMSFSQVLVDRSALWDGGVWYFERDLMQGAAPATSQASRNDRLVRAPASGSGAPEVMATLETDDAWLLDGGDRLWVISPGEVWSWHDGELHPEWQGTDLGCMTRPFRFDGRPAVVTQDPDGFWLRVLGDTGWQVRGRFALGMREPFRSASEDMQVVSSAQGLQVFVRVGDTLYWRQGMPLDRELVEPGPWQALGKVSRGWTSTVLGGEPAVFTLKQHPSTRLVGLHLEGGRWREIFSTPMLMNGAAVLEGENPGRYTIVTSGFPASLLVLSVQDGKVVDRVTHGSGFPFPKMMLYMLAIPQAATFGLPLILALIFTVLMARHRTSSFRSEGTSVRFASLARRAFAQLIDAVILSGPVVAAFILTFTKIFDFDQLTSGDPTFFLHAMGLVLAGLAWALVCFLAYSAAEGAWGTTPGKWLLGIRVLGSDLQPCGFGRALIRNLLKFVDGFFNFMVGVMVVALSENWQRVGDMAARTVVVEMRRRPEGGFVG